MKNSTRVTLCLVLLAIATPLVLSDEGDEQEPGSQEAPAQEDPTTQAPEGATEANEDEEPVTKQEEPKELELMSTNILLAPTACKPGYRPDHKGKCRPAL